MSLAIIEREMVAAKPYFEYLNPSWIGLFRHRLVKLAGLSLMVLRQGRAIKRGKPVEDVIGEFIAGQINRAVATPVRSRIVTAHTHTRQMSARDMFRKNGMGGRSWYYKPGRHQMTLVFHDANKAGPHVDVHIGRLSLVYRVPDRLYNQLRYNNDGYLTQESQKLLVNYVRDKVDAGAPAPQNLDHSKTNAIASWTGGSRGSTSYGSGLTRQVIASEEVDIFKARADGPIEFYAPMINPHRGMYLYRVHPGDEKQAPIIIWGNLKSEPPKLHDRLHLKMIEQVDDRVDPATITTKYDGSSCYIVSDKKGTRVYSPRQAKATGEQIEYTFKLDGLASVTSPEKIVAMGELLFRRDSPLPWRRSYLPQAQGSGILNSNAVLPRGVTPEIRLYRVDRVGRHNVADLSFFENRKLQDQVATLSKRHFKVVSLTTPERAAKEGYEGVVGVPHGGSVNDGFKIKWLMDPHDWQIERVALHDGQRGGIAGVVHLVSLESGKHFKLGPGQLGNHAFNREMMQNPERYEGRVIRVVSRHGHEGRAARLLDFHDDKGLA